MRAYYFALIITSLLLFSGCEEEYMSEPENLIPEDNYIDLLVELQLFDALIYTSDSLSYTDSLKIELFKYYDTTEEDFFLSHRYYQSKIPEHKVRLDSVLKFIDEQKLLINQEPDSSGN